MNKLSLADVPLHKISLQTKNPIQAIISKGISKLNTSPSFLQIVNPPIDLK